MRFSLPLRAAALTACMAALLVPVTANAADATASASADIIAPISITTNQNLAFGSVSVGASGGTAVVSVAGAKSVTGDVVNEGGSHAQAIFDVNGSANSAYDITLPSSISVTAGANSMTVDTFNSDKAGNSSSTDGTGADQFNVGATLNVGANQAGGTYSGNFTVTVLYQ